MLTDEHMTNEELLQEDLPEILKLWFIVKKMKSERNGEINIIIRDATIVNVKQSKLWVHTGKPFETCEL